MKDLENNVHFISVTAILLALSIKYWVFLIVLVIYLIFIYKKTKLLKLCLIISVLIGFSSLRYLVQVDKSEVMGIVVDKSGENYILLTHYGHLYISGEDIELGDVGKYQIIERTSSIVTAFDYNDYRLNKGLISSYNIKTQTVSTNVFVLSKIHYYLIDNVSINNNQKDYINSFIFGENTLNDNVNSNTKKTGISHILAMSGLHVSLLLGLFMVIIDKIFRYTKTKEICEIIFLIFILLVSNFSISVTRTSLMMIISIILKRKRTLFTSLDIWSMTLILMLVINPRSIYLSGFLLSYLSTFTLIMLKESSLKGFKKVIFTSFIMMVVTLPIIVKMNYEVNLLSFIISPIISLYFEFVLFPLTILSLFLSFLSPYLTLFFSIFESSINYLGQIDLFILKLQDISVYIIAIYYTLLYLYILKRKTRYIITIGFIIFLPTIIKFINPTYQVTMYNVGQGDSFLITTPNSKTNILIDCFGDIKNILRKSGVTCVDYVFLTHGDSDHINGFSDIVSEYNVKKIYTTKYTTSETLKEIEDNYHVNYLKNGDYFSIDNVKFQVLSPNTKASSENDNSLVMKVTIDNCSILFTGDIEDEKTLINTYGYYLKSDILKSAHHGAKTSSSKELLEYVSPDNVLISVGKNNYYGHPNNSYLLGNFKCYRTDQNGTVRITYYKGKYVINNLNELWYNILD